MFLGQIDPALESALAEQFASLDVYAESKGADSYQSLVAISFAPTLLDWRTQDFLVPDTEAGKAYKAIPAIAREIAKRLLAVFDSQTITGPLSLPIEQRVENLAKALLLGPFNVPFNDAFGGQDFVTGDWRENLLALTERPIFAWKNDAPLRVTEYRKIQIPIPYQSAGSDAFVAPPYLVFLLSQGQFNAVSYDPSIGFFDKNASGSEMFANTFKNQIIHDAPYSQFPGTTFQILDLLRKIREVVDQIEKAEARNFWISTVVAFAAFAALPAAISAIESGGLSLANSAKLLAAVDRIPGVDFGVASDILRVVNRAYSGIGSFAVQATDSAQPGADQMTDVFEGGYYEVTSPESYWGDLGVPSIDLPEFDFGAITDSLVQTATAPSGEFSLSSFLTDLAKTYVQYDLSKRAIETQTGQRVPAQVTRPAPGTTRTLPDGSVARTNADGSTTITSPTGEQRTVTSTGQIVRGGVDLIPGIPNIALLIGGGLLLGGLLLARR